MPMHDAAAAPTGSESPTSLLQRVQEERAQEMLWKKQNAARRKKYKQITQQLQDTNGTNALTAGTLKQVADTVTSNNNSRGAEKDISSGVSQQSNARPHSVLLAQRKLSSGVATGPGVINPKQPLPLGTALAVSHHAVRDPPSTAPGQPRGALTSKGIAHQGMRVPPAGYGRAEDDTAEVTSTVAASAISQLSSISKLQSAAPSGSSSSCCRVGGFLPSIVSKGSSNNNNNAPISKKPAVTSNTEAVFSIPRPPLPPRRDSRSTEECANKSNSNGHAKSRSGDERDTVETIQSLENFLLMERRVNEWCNHQLHPAQQQQQLQAHQQLPPQSGWTQQEKRHPVQQPLQDDDDAEKIQATPELPSTQQEEEEEAQSEQQQASLEVETRELEQPQRDDELVKNHTNPHFRHPLAKTKKRLGQQQQQEQPRETATNRAVSAPQQANQLAKEASSLSVRPRRASSSSSLKKRAAAIVVDEKQEEQQEQPLSILRSPRLNFAALLPPKEADGGKAPQPKRAKSVTFDLTKNHGDIFMAKNGVEFYVRDQTSGENVLPSELPPPACSFTETALKTRSRQRLLDAQKASSSDADSDDDDGTQVPVCAQYRPMALSNGDSFDYDPEEAGAKLRANAQLASGYVTSYQLQQQQEHQQPRRIIIDATFRGNNANAPRPVLIQQPFVTDDDQEDCIAYAGESPVQKNTGAIISGSSKNSGMPMGYEEEDERTGQRVFHTGYSMEEKSLLKSLARLDRRLVDKTNWQPAVQQGVPSSGGIGAHQHPAHVPKQQQLERIARQQQQQQYSGNDPRMDIMPPNGAVPTPHVAMLHPKGGIVTGYGNRKKMRSGSNLLR